MERQARSPRLLVLRTGLSIIWRYNFRRFDMPEHFDILIRQAQVRDSSQAVDIGIAAGRVTALASKLDNESELTIDARGCLVTPSFINPHLHLCKVYTRQMMDDEALTGYHAEGMGKAMTT